MRFGEEGGLSSDFNFAIFFFDDKREEFYDIAEIGGEFDIEGGDFLDAAHVDFLVVDEKPVSE